MSKWVPKFFSKNMALGEELVKPPQFHTMVSRVAIMLDDFGRGRGGGICWFEKR